MTDKVSEYIGTGAVSDDTPPPSPLTVTAIRNSEKGVTVTWMADADLESGIRCFVIERDGERIGQVPEAPQGRFGRPLFQGMSYHDTPAEPLPEMRFVDVNGSTPAGTRYAVKSVNSVGLVSEPTTSQALRTTQH